MNHSDCSNQRREFHYWKAFISTSDTAIKAIPAVIFSLFLFSTNPASAQERVLGADISYWNCGTGSTGISQANWSTAYTTGKRVFVFIRSTRGGTTGLDESQGTPGGGSEATLSRRYDDCRFVQNLIRAVAAGMLTGPYHFARPDVSGNTGADEANHFMQMAGAWMRPGYMMPMFDQEAGSGSDTLVQFAIDFSDRIYEVMKIRPCIYINGNYSSIFQGATKARRDLLAKPAGYAPTVVSPAYPMLWDARYGMGAVSQTDPDFDITQIPIQTGSPKDNGSVNTTYYGPWDDYGDDQPWSFWQYASIASIPGFNAVDATVDSNVSHGDIEYVRNYLVPAVWWNDNSGDWSTLTNWNCGQTPVAPVTPADQAAPYATGGLPTARLPGAAGTGPTSGQYDTVILERPDANITVTVSSGTHNVRKLYMRETLNITGGSLTANYNPEYRPDDSVYVMHGGPLSAQFSGPVTLGGTGSLTAHTIQVDSTNTFTISGGALTIDTLKLMPHASSPAKILITGDATFNSRSNAAAVITNGVGAGASGFINLNGGMRALTVNNGTNTVDLSIHVPITNGGFTKAGPGTLRLAVANTYAGSTIVSAGRLQVDNATGSGAGSGAMTVNGGILCGVGTISGAVILNSGGTIAPGTSEDIGKLTLSNAPTLLGTNLMRIDRNGGSTLADKLSLTTGSLTYGGTLVVSNIGAALEGGEVFTLFSASQYKGAFSATNLPALGNGMNWHTGLLTNNGTIKVNRKPTASTFRFTNTAPAMLLIPFSTLRSGATDPDADTLTVSGVTMTTTNGITLMTNATSITYSNRASAIDQFSYTITDSRGGFSTGLVNIVNIGVSPSAQFSGSPTFSGNLIQLHFSGTPGWTYYLDSSTNLTSWRTIWTNVAPSNGLFDYTDTSNNAKSSSFPSFYRLRWLP